MKKVLLILLIFFISGLLHGCYDRVEIDNQGYVIAIGLDKGKTNNLRMTLQIAVPSAFGENNEGGNSDGGGEGSTPKSITMTTIETPSIYAGFNTVNTFISKKINLSHAKALIISSELAQDDMQKYINAINRGREFRNTMFVGVCTGSAEEFLKNVNYVLDISPAKFYEGTFESYSYTAFNANTQFVKLYNHSKSLSINPTATLVGVDKNETLDEFKKENSSYIEKGRSSYFEGDFFAGNIPKEYKNKTSIMGLAVFRGAQMVGVLDGQESRYFLMITGDYNYSYFTIPDPEIAENLILLNIKQNRKPRCSVTMVNDAPLINVKILLEADILSIQSGINYESTERLNELQTTAQDFLKNEILQLLEKTSREFKSDIFGFGRNMKWRFLTWKEWVDFDWLSKYENAKFNVDVELKIRRPGLIIKTEPFES